MYFLMFYADYDFNLYFIVNVGVLHLFKQYFSYVIGVGLVDREYKCPK